MATTALRRVFLTMAAAGMLSAPCGASFAAAPAAGDHLAAARDLVARVDLAHTTY